MICEQHDTHLKNFFVSKKKKKKKKKQNLQFRKYPIIDNNNKATSDCFVYT